MRRAGRGGGSAGREGVVLVAAVMVLLALGIAATGLLFISTQEALIARSGEDAVRVRVAAEAAVRAAIAEWHTNAYRDLGVGARRAAAVAPSIDGIQATVTVERLAGRLFLVRAEAEKEPSPGASASAAALVRAIGLDEVWSGFPAAVAARGPVDIAASAVVTGFVEGSAARCPPESVDSLRQALGSDSPAAVLEPPAAVIGDPWTDPPGPGSGFPVDSARLGPLGWGEVARLADRIESVAPISGPRDPDGPCESAAMANRGVPDACGITWPLIYVPGDLHLTTGVAQGILIVEGDLVLSGDAVFHGAIRVGGRFVARGAARVHGAVAVAGSEGARIDDATHIGYDVCALWSAFTSAPGLNRALVPAERHWVPVP